MPNGRRKSYEAVTRRPEQQGTEGPALSMSPVFSVPLLPCLKHTLSLSQTYSVPISALCYSQNLFICYPVSYYKQLVHLSTRPPVNLPRYLVFLIPYPCLKHTQSPSQSSVTPRTCSSVTMSQTYLVPVSNIPRPCLSPLLLPELVHLLPCLSHTLSPYPPYPVPLSTLPCPYPVTKKVKPYSFTFFFFPLLSLLIRSRAVTTKTYFVCPP